MKRKKRRLPTRRGGLGAVLRSTFYTGPPLTKAQLDREVRRLRELQDYHAPFHTFPPDAA